MFEILKKNVNQSIEMRSSSLSQSHSDEKIESNLEIVGTKINSKNTKPNEENKKYQKYNDKLGINLNVDIANVKISRDEKLKIEHLIDSNNTSKMLQEKSLNQRIVDDRT